MEILLEVLIILATSINADPIVAGIAELMNSGKMPPASQLKGVNSADLLKKFGF